MKFKIRKTIIEKRMNDVTTVVSSNNIIATPIFKAVLFEIFNNEIVIKASNTSVSINTKIKTDETDVQVESTGIFLTPIKKLQELIKKIDSTFLIFEKTDEAILTISTNKSRYSLQIYEAKNYPKINFETKGIEFNIKEKIFDEVLNKIVFSADNEHKQSRKEFSGINLVSQDNKLNIIATNMHRLSKLTTETTQDEINIIIPTTFFKIANKINSLKNTETKTWISQEKIQFQNDHTVVQFQNIVGKYPDISRVIPNEFKTSIIVDKNELEKALDRIEMFTNEENKIKISISNEKMIINSTNQTVGISLEKIEKFNKQGEDIDVLVSSRYLLDAIKTIKNKEIKINFNSNLTPILIKDSLDEKTIHIVLPYRSEN